MRDHPRLAAAFGALVLAGCSSAPESPPPPASAAWQVVLDSGDLDRAVLSVWGSGPDDVFAVGGPLGNTGFETLALHYDGAAWQELAPGGDETLWWVSGSSPTDVWMVGEAGRALHWDGEEFAEHETGTTATLWGVVAFSPEEAWIVGGDAGSDPSAPKDVVLRWDGAVWSPAPLPELLGRALFKVWGESSEDLYIVGESGVIWHRVGATWQLESDPPLARGNLFTVTGCGPDDVYAVGGQDVLHSDGAGWTRVELELNSTVNGVACGRPGEVAIVGYGALKQRLIDGAWINEWEELPHADLHAVWGDGQGSFWAVGGNFLTRPAPGQPREGVVARYGVGRAADGITR